MAALRIDRVEARERLKARRDPYWFRISQGNYVGFRKMAISSDGTWVARSRDSDTGKQHLQSLGELKEHPKSERFDAACTAARTWFNHIGRGGTTKAVTVEKACANYVQRLREETRDAAARDAELRFARLVDKTPFGRTELLRLRGTAVAAWRIRLTQTLAIPQDKSKVASRPRAAGTINRDMTALRAALNDALENGDVTDDSAWRAKLKPIENADGRRDVYLDIGQRRNLIAKAGPDLSRFLRGLSMVPLRPGALAKLSVRDFDTRLSALAVGVDKRGQPRKIVLPPVHAEFFSALATDRPPCEPLFARDDGVRWNKDAWKAPVKCAVLAAKLPSKTTAYALRHSTITDLLAVHRLDTLTVARLSGTSLAMIEKHYGHLLQEHAAKALEGLAV